MTSSNGQRPAKPPMDMNLLAPNAVRRLRARMAEAGVDLDEVMRAGRNEDVVQAMILGFKLREQPDLTWDEAGDILGPDVFDLEAREPDPPTAPDGSPGPASGPPAATASKPPRSRRASAPSSAPSTG